MTKKKGWILLLLLLLLLQSSKFFYFKNWMTSTCGGTCFSSSDAKSSGSHASRKSMVRSLCKLQRSASLRREKRVAKGVVLMALGTAVELRMAISHLEQSATDIFVR